MKKIGIALMVIGLVFTLITGFKFITKEKVVEIGDVNISRDKTHSIVWSPIVGVVIMAIGGGLFILGNNKK